MANNLLGSLCKDSEMNVLGLIVNPVSERHYSQIIKDAGIFLLAIELAFSFVQDTGPRLC